MSESLQDRVRLFESRVDSILVNAYDCVRELIEERDEAVKYLLAERISVLGSALLPKLRSALADPGVDEDSRYLAAWVAVTIGDRGKAVDVLCDQVARATKWAVPAAGVLGDSEIGQGREVILRALEHTDPKEGIAVAGFSRALRAVGGHLPADLRSRILENADPWIAQAVASDFPEGA